MTEEKNATPKKTKSAEEKKAADEEKAADEKKAVGGDKSADDKKAAGEDKSADDKKAAGGDKSADEKKAAGEDKSADEPTKADRAEVKVQPASLLVTASSPHVHGPESVSKIMWTVVACLLPATVVGVYRFGMDAAVVISTCVGAAIIFEAVIQRLTHKEVTVSDGSAVLTGLLLGLNLPAGCPIYVCLVGSLVAVGLAKAVFGGLGHNPFNPALTARVFLLIAFPVALTTWPLTRQQTENGPPDKYFSLKTTWKDAAGRKLTHKRQKRAAVDVVTAATPLPAIKKHWKKGTLDLINHSELLLGNQPGCIGEVCALALLLGGLVLLMLGYITWHIPVAYIMTVAVIAAVSHGADPEQYAGPLFHVLAGGLMLGAIFMATDYVTSPVYPKGKILFGVGCGVLTMIIRLWGGYPEGVSFAILLMNAVTPLIDRITRPQKYGLQRWAAPQKGS